MNCNKTKFTTNIAHIPLDSPNRQYIIAKGDSAESHNYWRQEDSVCLARSRNSTTKSVLLPNAQSIKSTTEGILALDTSLSNTARKAMVLPQLKSSSLISLGQLCDDDCKVHLDKKTLKVIKNNKLILDGQRNQSDGLWDIPI